MTTILIKKIAKSTNSTYYFLCFCLLFFNISIQKASAQILATGGTGKYKNNIYWLNFTGLSLSAGASKTFTFTVKGVTITAIIDNVTFSTAATTNRIIPYISGRHDEDRLNYLYNIGGTGLQNTLENAIRSNTFGVTANYRIRTYATVNNQPTDIGLVFGNAESDNAIGNEYTQGITNGSNWQLIESFSDNINKERKITFSNNDKTVRLQCNQNTALLYTQQTSTSITNPLTIDAVIKADGRTGMALGVISYSESGDAPVSYGSPSHMLTPTLTGGTNPNPGVAQDVYISNPPTGSQLITAGTVNKPLTPRLGLISGDFDPPSFPSQGINADADDRDGEADEDGITNFPRLPANAAAYSVNTTATNNSINPAYIAGWIDFNRNGTFEPEEGVLSTVPAGADNMPVTLTWNGLTTRNLSAGQTYARFRISTNPALTTSTPVSVITDGEVEDYTLQITALDFGDAPVSYGTLLAQDGPRHVLDNRLIIGRTIDGEPNGQPVAAGTDANGLNGDGADEDGFTTLPVLTASSTTYSVNVPVTNMTGVTAKLAGWVDFNKNGVFDAPEGVVANVPAGATAISLTWSGLTNLTAGITYARFRLSTDNLTTSATGGAATDGEVEDYSLVIQPSYDLGVTKTATPATAGQPLTYLITLRNNGPSPVLPADVISVTDNLPAGFITSAYTPLSGTYTSSTGSWTGLSLASGQTTTLTITGAVTPGASGTLTNTALVTNPPGITDPVPDNNTSSVTSDISRILDLGVTKTSSPTPVLAGQTLTYTITLKNNGPSSLLATDMVTVTDNLPAGFTASAYTVANGTYNSSNGNWSGLTLATGQTTTLTITGTVSAAAAGSLSNTVSLVPPAGTADPTPANNTATEITPVNRQIDFSLTKTASPATVATGQTLTYTLTLKNNGSSTVLPTDVIQVVDHLPAEFTASSFTPATGTYNSTNGNWTGLTLASGQSTALTITGILSPAALAGTLTNTATVTSPAEITDPDLTNNTATNTVSTTRVIDLGVTKSALPDPAVAGQPLTYTITLTNSGPGSVLATDIIQVADNLPAGFNAPVYTPATGSYTSSTGNWTGLTLASGQSATLTVAGSVAANATGSLSNTATVTVPDGVTDPTSGNNASTITTPVNRVIDLNVTKTASPKPAIAGQLLTYTINLANAGPGALLASDIIKVTDNLPAGFTATTFIPASGNYNSSNGNWTGLTLAQGQNTNLTITGSVSPTASGSLTNTAIVTPPAGVTDPTPNTATDITTISRVIDFSIVKTASPTGIAGEALTYTIILTNNGPGTLAATDILTLSDNLPQGFIVSSYSAAAGNYDNSNGTWSGLTLTKGQSTSLTITGKIAPNTTGTLSNTATITGPPAITDPTPGNNTSAVTTNIINKPALKITKMGAAGLTAGNTATYTLTITNTGSSDALGASITDRVPAALTNVSWTSTIAGAATIGSNATGTGNNVSLIADIPAGIANIITVTITGTVNSGATGSISNTATVTPAEPAGTGSNSTVTSNITSTSGIVMTKTGPSAATAGDQITYQIEVGNNGPSNATGINIADIVPANLSNVSWTTQTTGIATITAGASGTGNNVNVMAGIAAGSSNKLVIIVSGTIDPSFTGNITNNAIATPQEPGSTPVTAQTVTGVQRLPLFTVTKSGPASAVGGNAIVYTILVKNTGPSNSINTLIADAVPAAVTNVSWAATVTSGTALINTGATGTGNAIALNANFNANSTLQIVVSGTIASDVSGTISNIATATPSETGSTHISSTPVNTVITSRSGLTISKSATPTINSGSSISYVITIGNTGPSDAIAAHIRDAIPVNIVNTIWTSVAQGSASVISGAAGTGNTLDAIANIPAGAANKIIFTVTGTADPAYSGNITNTASVTATEPNSPSPAATVITAASRVPVLSINKSGPASINAGETISYTINVVNNSTSDALNMAISDLVPATISNVNWVASTTGNAQLSGTLTGTGNTINLQGNLAAGQANQVKIIVTGKINPAFSGSLSNTATVTPAEPGTTAASATATTNVTRIPVLTIQKNGPSVISAGQAITYTISVKNISQANATAAVITDIIPAGILNPVWTATTAGTATITTGASGSGYNLSVTGNLAGNTTDEILITISGTVDPGAAANISNSAIVTPSEPGSIPKTAGPVITTITKTPSISLTKTGPATANAGETLSYVINALNNGPSNASALVITDNVPAALTNVTWTAAAAGTSSVTNSTGTGNTISVTGNLNVGNANNIRITVSGKLSSAQTSTVLTNTATATPAEPGITPVQSNTVSTTIGNKTALRVTKSGPPTVNAGGNVVYHLTVSNNGPSDALDAILTDQIPSGLTNVTWSSAISGLATISSGTTGSGNTLAVTASIPSGTGNHIDVTITGTLSAGFTGTSFSNSATITPAEAGNDPVVSNTVTTAVTRTSHLHILKSGTADAVAGSPVSYTIRVSNSGPTDVTGAQVQDIIPPGILNPVWTVTTSAGAGSSISNGTGNVNLLASLKANPADSLLITINGTLDPLFAGNSLTNTATATPPADDSNPATVSSTVVTNTTRSANVRIVKSGPADAVAGEVLQYTLRITNAGPSTAIAVNITDVIPAEILDANWTATGSGGATISAASGTGNVNLSADIPSGTAYVDVVITGTASPALTDGTIITNKADITSTIVPDPETIISNTSAITTKIANKPFISVSKSGPATANIGDPITYRIIIKNVGPGDITDAVITDQVPEDVQVINWSATAIGSAVVDGPISGTTNTIATTGDIMAGSTNAIEILINGTVINKGNTQFTNTVTVVSNGTETSSITTSLHKSTDLIIEKQGPQTIAAGENITYTMKVFNNSSIDVPMFNIADNVPSAIVINKWTATAFGNASVTGTATGNNGNIVVAGSIAAGNANYLLLTVNGKIPSNAAAGNITNTATVTLDSSTGLTDYNTANNTSSVTTAILNSPALQVSKSGPNTTVAGEQVHYSIQVTNNGPSDANAVTIGDVVPAALQNISWTATSTGTATITTNPASGIGNPVVLANIPQGTGNIISVDITGTINPGFTGTMANTATVQNGTDPVVSSPVVNTVVNKVTAISIRKSGPASTTAGLPLVYTIEVTNAGPSDATAAAITDAIPAELQNVSWTTDVQNGALVTSGATGTGNALNIIANIPGAVGARILITITGTIPSSATASLVNTATVTRSEIGNPPVISTPVPTVIAKIPGIVLLKSGPAKAAAGEKITYTLNLTNTGPSDAVNTALTDIVPAAIQNVTWAATASNGAAISTGSSGTGNRVTTNADIPVGGAVNVVITGDIGATFNGNIVNTATTTPSETGIDPKSSSVTTEVKPVVNLSVTKSGPATLQAGQEINYEVRVTNSGPSTAVNAVIADLVQADITQVQWKATVTGNAVLTGASSGNSNTIATQANLPPGTGDAVIVQIRGLVSPSFNGQITNTATVTSAEDPLNPVTSTPLVTNVTRSPVIKITKTGPATLPAGADINYLITVSNEGTSDALNLAISDIIPAIITNINWTATANGTAAIISGATGNNNYNMSIIADLPAGSTNTIVIHITGTLPANAIGNLQNTATVTPAEPGTVPATSPPVNTTIQAVADLSVTNMVNQSIQKIGGSVTFTIQVNNNGPSNATGVNVTDLLPAGYQITNQSARSGTYNPATGLWTIGNLANGAVTTLTIEATLVAGGPYETTALVSGNETDPLLTNNTAKIAVSILNSYPVANADSGTLLEDHTLTVSAENGLLANDSDADKDVLQVSKFTIAGVIGDQPVGSAVLIPGAGTITINSDGSYLFVPVQDYNGTVPVITYSITDGNGGSASSTLALNVIPVNDAPGFTKGADQILLPHSPAQTIPGWATMITTGPTDEAGQKYDFIVTNTNNTLFTTQPAIATDGTLTFTPAFGASGTVTVTVILKDDGGTANGGIDQSVTQIFTITLAAGNPSMSLTKAAVNTGAQVGDIINYTIVVTNTGDVNLDNITVTDQGADAGSIIPANIVSLAPAANVTVIAHHTLTQADIDAGTYSNQASAQGADPSGNPVIRPKSDDPNTPAPDDATTILISQKLMITLVKTGILSTDGNSITYSFTIQNTSNVTYNTVILNDAKLGISNKPVNVGTGLSPGASVTVTEVYNLNQTDKSSAKVSNTASVTGTTLSGTTATDISGTAATNNNPTETIVPNSPVAINDQTAGNANSPIVIDVLTNDNPGNSAFDHTTLVIITQPQHGKITVNNDGTITYTPAPGYSGPDSFTYQIKDKNGYPTNIASVMLDLNFFEISIPTLFTPNGDGKNDVFEIRGLNQYAENELSIVNRWGNEVYRQKNYQNNWNGEGLNEGTYYYLLRVKPNGANTQWQVFKGYTTLIRTFKK